jgi:hypothetical protein
MFPGPELAMTDGHMKATGRIVVNWAALEAYVDACLLACLGAHQETAWLLVAHLTYPQKRDALRATNDLIKEGDPGKIEFDDLMREIGACNAIRDMVAHGRWMNGKRPNSIKIIRIKARGKVSFQGASDKDKDYTPEGSCSSPW